jgi:hypothetical protein
MSLNTLRADVRRDELLREAKRARLAGRDTSRESLFRRAVARLYADAGSSASPHRGHPVAPATR